MARRNKPEGTEKSAADQIYIFATCGNFPRDQAGLEALAEALESASKQTGVSMKAIVTSCATGGAWCPTPYDILQAAVKLKGDQKFGFTGCEKCNHTGWVMKTKGIYEYSVPCPECRAVPA